MSDEQEQVETGGESSSVETPVETPAAEVAADGPRAGDSCKCPDGRTGTLHQFDADFVCIPNHDQA